MTSFEDARDRVLSWLGDTLDVPADQIDRRKPLGEIQLDSLDAVHLIATIEGVIRRELPENVMLQVSCLDDIFDLMRERLSAA